MDFVPSRLRRGEVIVGASALLLLALMFFVKWYGPVNGWHALHHVRWLLLVTIALALALVFFTATRRAPAIPVSINVVLVVVAIPNLLWLGYRVLISVPPGEKAGAYIGLACALGIFIGACMALRREGMPERDIVTQIETVRLDLR
jgi:hypothetical protein